MPIKQDKSWQQRKKIRGKIRPTVPRKAKPRERNICEYHDDCDKPPKPKEVSKATKTVPRKPVEIIRQASEYHKDCENPPNPKILTQKASPTVPRKSK